MVVRTKILAVMACALILFAGSTANAGVLAGNALAYNNGLGPLAGAWTGTAPFANDGLNGTIDWAVFTSATFNALFGGGGYTPPANQLVYTHQIFTVGPTIGVSGMDIALAGNPVGTAGSFQSGGVAGVATAATSVIPTLASFTLVSETSIVNPSRGLAYSSPNNPMLTGFPIVVDGGLSAQTTIAIGIPGPNGGIIPEPATCLIASLAGVLLFVVRGRRRS
jgi:hypothetical protein